MMKQWKIQYNVMVGTQEDPDWDAESQWMESEEKPTKEEASYETGVPVSDIVQILEIK